MLGDNGEIRSSPGAAAATDLGDREARLADVAPPLPLLLLLVESLRSAPTLLALVKEELWTLAGELMLLLTPPVETRRCCEDEERFSELGGCCWDKGDRTT